MNEIRWGIIGCGDVTEIKSGPAFNLVPNSTLVAVMRRDSIKAANYANRHGVPKWYGDAARLIEDGDVNAIYVATPPAFHEEYSIAALAAGKPVYVEKPMSVNSESARRMADAAKLTGVPMSVAHYRREQPRIKYILKLIDEEYIGRVSSIDLEFRESYHQGVESSWRVNPALSGGGLFYDLAPHQLDLMVYFFGVPLIVTGTSMNRAGFYEADDYTTCEMVFENNIKFTGTWDFNTPPGNEADICVINGSDGNIKFPVFGDLLEITRYDETIRPEFPALKHVQQPMIEQVVRYFRNERGNPCSADEGYEVMRIIDKAAGKSM